MMAEACWLFLVVLLVLVRLGSLRRSSAGGLRSASAPRVPRPRDPGDCPHCRDHAAVTDRGAAHPPPRPWREGKSRRGAPKRVATDGFACPNAACTYYRVADAAIHALVGDGRHGRAERIQTFRCQACRAT